MINVRSMGKNDNIGTQPKDDQGEGAPGPGWHGSYW